MATFSKRPLAAFVAGSLLTLGLIALLIALLRDPVEPEVHVDLAAESRVLRFEELNFSFRQPDHSWSRVDAHGIHPDATLGFVRQEPQMAFLLTAETPGIERPADLATLKDILLANHRSLWEQVNVRIGGPETLDGIRGERIFLELRGSGQTLNHVTWIGLHAGYAFQLDVFSPGSDEKSLSAAADELFSRFSLIDRSRVAHSGKAVQDFDSTRHGYVLRLAGTNWQPWENLADVLPDAECGAMIGNYARAAVIPMSLLGRTPRLEALTAALVVRLGIVYSASTARILPKPPELDGHRFETTREVSGRTYTYRFQIVQHAGRAFLVAAWADKSAPGGTADRLTDLLDRFELRSSVPPAAVRPEELTVEQKPSHAQFLNDLGRYHFNARMFGESLDYFRQAFELLENDPVLLGNVVNAYVELNRFPEARDYLQKHLSRFSDHLDLKARLGFVQARAGDVQSALETYGELFSGSYRDDDALSAYIELLIGENQEDQALAQLKRYEETGPSILARRLTAAIYARKGDHAQSAAVLTALVRSQPFDPELAYDLADQNLAAGQWHDGLTVCHKLIERHFDTASTYFLKGRLELQLKWYAAAKSSFEAALQKDPSNQAASECLDQVSGMLGEGDNSTIKEPISPVPLPSQLVQRPTDFRFDAETQQYGACYIDRSEAISFVAAQEFKRTTRQVIKLFDASGATRFSTFQIEFYPLAEQLYVNMLRVTDGEGKEIARGKPSDYYVVDDTDGGVASGRKVLGVPVPGLQPGYRIELMFTRRDLVPPKSFPLVEHYFAADVPLLRDSVFIAASGDSVLARPSPGLTSSPVEGGQLWTIERPALYRFEPMQAPLSSFVPHVLLGAAAGSWEDLASEYLGSIADRLEIEPSTRTLASETASKSLADDARALALAQLVRDQITYKAIEFGRRARVPNKASTIVANRYGDCKDHSLLLCQLLRASDIEAHLALVRTDAPVDESLPSLDQFDHMIVFAPKLAGGRFFDCTDKQAAFDGSPPWGLASRPAFVLDTAGPRFVPLPAYPPDKNRLLSEQTVKLVDGADLWIDETLRLEGHVAATLRALLKDIPPANRTQALQTQLSAVAGGPLQVQKTDIDHLENPSVPLTLRMEVRLKGKFSRVGNSLVGQVPALWERFLLRAQRVERRQTPFVARYPLQLKSVVTLNLPDGYSVAEMNRLQKQEQSQFAEWRVSAAPVGNALRIDFEVSRAAGQHAADQYAAYCDSMEQTLGAIAQNIVLNRD